MQEVPIWLGRPLWVDDPDFTLSFHVRHTALPAPGDDEQLRTLCARLLSTALTTMPRPRAGMLRLAGAVRHPRSTAGDLIEDVREVRHALGGTVNDAVLALVTGGFRDLLLANRVSAMVAELPVHLSDPLERLLAVRAELDRLKASGESRFGEVVTEAAGLAPPLLLSVGLFGGFPLPQRQLVTVTTNVPGPRVPCGGSGGRCAGCTRSSRSRTGCARGWPSRRTTGCCRSG